MPKPSKVKRVKGGKGKKDGKHESKPDKESDVETARANAALWELKLKIINQDLAEYREAHHKLARANDQLTNQLSSAEMDSMTATRYWETEVEHKNEQIRNLEDELENQEALALEEKNRMIQEFRVMEKKMRKLEDANSQLETDLLDIKNIMTATVNDHKDILRRVRVEFCEEKVKLRIELEAEFNEKLEEQNVGHHEAILQLERLLHSESMENQRLKEELKNTTEETENLKRLTYSVSREISLLVLEKEMLESTVKKNAEESEAREKKLSQLLAKNASLEQNLQQMEIKLEQQVKKKEMHLVAIQASQVEFDKLQKVLNMREKEINRVKLLAGTIVKKRTEVEKFFHEALDHVREEVAASRLQSKKEALHDYQLKFRDATAGKIKFPPIRTFNNNPNSTSSVYTDMEAAETWPYPPGNEVQISDLTWEQKEKVLSLLFAKMNGLA